MGTLGLTTSRTKIVARLDLASAAVAMTPLSLQVLLALLPMFVLPTNAIDNGLGRTPP